MAKIQVKLIHWSDSLFSFKKQPVLSARIVPKTIFFCDRKIIIVSSLFLSRNRQFIYSQNQSSEENQSVSKVLGQVKQTVIFNNKSELLQSVELQCLQSDRTLKTSGCNPVGELWGSNQLCRPTGVLSFLRQETGPGGISRILQRQELLQTAIKIMVSTMSTHKQNLTSKKDSLKNSISQNP